MLTSNNIANSVIIIYIEAKGMIFNNSEVMLVEPMDLSFVIEQGISATTTRMPIKKRNLLNTVIKTSSGILE